jgi:hypothetical protein
MDQHGLAASKEEPSDKSFFLSEGPSAYFGLGLRHSIKSIGENCVLVLQAPIDAYKIGFTQMDYYENMDPVDAKQWIWAALIQPHAWQKTYLMPLPPHLKVKLENPQRLLVTERFSCNKVIQHTIYKVDGGKKKDFKSFLVYQLDGKQNEYLEIELKPNHSFTIEPREEKEVDPK